MGISDGGECDFSHVSVQIYGRDNGIVVWVLKNIVGEVILGKEEREFGKNSFVNIFVHIQAFFKKIKLLVTLGYPI